MRRRLQQEWSFQVWSESADGSCIARWMTAFDTSEADVDRLAKAIAESAVSRETESADGPVRLVRSRQDGPVPAGRSGPGSTAQA